MNFQDLTRRIMNAETETDAEAILKEANKKEYLRLISHNQALIVQLAEALEKNKMVDDFIELLDKLRK